MTDKAATDILRLRTFGMRDYGATWQAMREFTDARDADTPDELWLLEHSPVYTLGLNGDPRHLLKTTDAPVLKTDRGGQITWHGPGQLIAYTLVDLRRKQLGIRALVGAWSRPSSICCASTASPPGRVRKPPGCTWRAARLPPLGSGSGVAAATTA